MRRFESVEGTSSKFWEIELQGAGFTVRWGRIGTAGQIQQKSFASNEKARVEHDKLVAEKLKKGYVEVGDSGAPAPPPPAAAQAAPKRATKAEPETPSEEKADAQAAPASTGPAPATTVPVPVPPAPLQAPQPSAEENGIVWTDALRRRVHPRRGGLQVPVRPLLSPGKAWLDVRDAWSSRVAPVREGRESAGDLGRLVDAVTARLEQADPSVGTPEEDAVLLAILQHRVDWRDHPDTDSAVDVLFSLGGAPHVTQAALLSLALYVDGSQPGRFVLQRGDDQMWWSALSRGYLRCLPRVRALLATEVDDATYAAARDAAAALRERASHTQRAGAAFLFPTETAWVRAEANDVAHGVQHPLILCSISDRDTLASVTPYIQGWHVLDGSGDYLPTLLEGVGADAIVLLRAFQAKNLSADGRRTCAEIASIIGTDEAMATLFDSLEEKEVLPFAHEAALRWPRRTLRLLGDRATLRGKAGDAPRTVLAAVVRRHPAVVEAELARLPDEVRRIIASLREQAGPELPDAPPEHLPPVLAQPPWRSRRPPAALPVIEGVRAPEVPDASRWLPGEREEWRRKKGWERWDDRLSTYSEAQWAELRRTLGPEDEVDASLFVYAPEDLARTHLHKLKCDRWGEAGWLPAIVARLEHAALPGVIEHVRKSGGDAYGLLLPLGRTSLAPLVAEALARLKKARVDARAWLLRHPEHATAGLLPDALGRSGKEKDAACAALRVLAANGHEALLLDVAGRVSEEARDALARILAFDPLLLYPPRLPKLPAFFDPAVLPRPHLADRSAQLPASAVEAIGMMLAFPRGEEPYAGLAQVKAACDPRSLARFAWAVFEAWMVAGAPSKEGWALQALGVFGDDEHARRLAALIREWPGEAAHARAVAGLDVLAAIGTDVTLMHLNAIAEKVKFKGLQQKAQEKIEEIAESRGLTRDELADRLVPDLGLDDDGSLQLDFGGRTFTVGFDEQLRPFVKDAQGARLKDLPKPTKQDDPEKAKAADERWKALKKDAKAAAGTQVLRMELGMCAKRRWSAEQFRMLFVEHPLLIHVVRRLVWGTYGPDDRLQATFRVAEDRSFADQNDDTWTLPDDARVGIPHALELDARTAAAWGQILADYEILQPFPQLGRPTFAPTDGERTARYLERLKGVKTPTGKVLGLEARGWRRGPPQDAGVVGWMEKHLGPDRMVELELDPGLFTGALSESPEQTLGHACVRRPNTWGDEGTVPLGELDPILFSELVRDLEGLRP